MRFAVYKVRFDFCGMTDITWVDPEWGACRLSTFGDGYVLLMRKASLWESKSGQNGPRSAQESGGGFDSDNKPLYDREIPLFR